MQIERGSLAGMIVSETLLPECDSLAETTAGTWRLVWLAMPSTARIRRYESRVYRVELARSRTGCSQTCPASFLGNEGTKKGHCRRPAAAQLPLEGLAGLRPARQTWDRRFQDPGRVSLQCALNSPGLGVSTGPLGNSELAYGNSPRVSFAPRTRSTPMAMAAVRLNTLSRLLRADT